MNNVSKKKRVLLAMSGGVDSSVTAALLKTEGHHVIGLHLRFEGPGIPEKVKKHFHSRCLRQNREESARVICNKLGITLHVIDAGENFCESVVDYSIHQALSLRKFNPCVPCHQTVILGMLQKKADDLKCEMIGTGHYAQISTDMSDSSHKVAQLRKATDLAHDQSSLLFQTPQHILTRLLLPLGGISKSMVLKLAVQFELFNNPENDDGRNICMTNGPAFWALLDSQVASSFRPHGMIRTQSGNLVGEHQGLYRNNLGDQRELGGIAKFNQETFVVAFDTKTNSLMMGQQQVLLVKSFIASNVSWIKELRGIKGLSCTARVGSRREEVACQVTSFEAGAAHIDFVKALYAINPGESIIFYDGDELLGGGYIDGPSDPRLLQDTTSMLEAKPEESPTNKKKG